MTRELEVKGTGAGSYEGMNGKAKDPLSTAPRKDKT